jgi:RNA polymerase sigma-70 factor (ECF subfamily)
LTDSPSHTRDLCSSPISFDEAYRAHAGYVAGLVGRILGRNDEVQDVVQEVFLKAYRGFGGLRGQSQSTVRAWLGRIAVREASRKLRWRRLRGFLDPARAVDHELVADSRAEPELRSLVAMAYLLLDRVPARERVAWVLRYLLEEPLEVVAEMCGCSLATAKRRIAAAERVMTPLLGSGGEEAE